MGEAKNIYFTCLKFFKRKKKQLCNQAAKMGKPRGIKTARKIRTHRRVQRWADKDYKKAHSGTALKANPFGGASHVKGIVLEKIGVEAKQPNSAIRKCVRVQLIKWKEDYRFRTQGRLSQLHRRERRSSGRWIRSVRSRRR